MNCIHNIGLLWVKYSRAVAVEATKSTPLSWEKHYSGLIWKVGGNITSITSLEKAITSPS